MYGGYGRDEIARHVRLEHVATRACGQNLVNHRFGIVHGEHHDFRAGTALNNLVGSLQTVEKWHSDVEQCHVRAGLYCFCDRFATVRRLGYHFPFGLTFEQAAQTGSDDLVIIGQQQT